MKKCEFQNGISIINLIIFRNLDYHDSGTLNKVDEFALLNFSANKKLMIEISMEQVRPIIMGKFEFNARNESIIANCGIFGPSVFQRKEKIQSTIFS